MKRKTVVVLMMSLLVVFCLNAANTQKQYQVSSYEWKIVNHLCLMSGAVGPSDVGPVSGEELLIALDRVELDSLNPTWQNEYEKVRTDIETPVLLLDVDSFGFDIEPSFSLELYAQKASDDWITNQDWYVDYKDRMRLLNLPLEFDFADMFYGVVEFFIAPRYLNSFFDDDFFTNTLFWKSESGIQRTMPFKVGIGGGNNFFHFYLGRDRQSIGNGYTGNLMIGDNFAYQEFAKLSFHNRVFTYNWNYTHYDQQKQTTYLPSNQESFGNPTLLENFAFGGNHQVRIIHSYALTPIDNLTLSLHFGNMIQSDSAFDLRMLNPFMFMHNYFNYAFFNNGQNIEANNHFAVAFNYVPLKNWQITGQMIVDQFKLAGENQAGSPPNALGFLLNSTYEIPVSNGVLSPYFEFVYTTPALYLNEKYIDKDGNIYHTAVNYDKDGHLIPIEKYDWNQDLIVGYSLWWGDDLSYVGYQYGPDNMVCSLGMNYLIPRVLDLRAFILFKMHGERGIAYHEKQDPRVPEAPNGNAWAIGLSGDIEYMLQFTVDATYSLTNWCDIRSSLTHIERFNSRNVNGDRWNDTQFTLGIKFQYSK